MRLPMFLAPSILAVAVAAIAFPASAADTAAPAAAAPKIRIVACDAVVQSHKRGLCANEMSAEDFKAIAPGVSWYYTWNFEPTAQAQVPEGVNVEFVPMVWGNSPEQLEGFRKYMKTGAKPRAVLALNEPNLKGQAFLAPEATALAYKKIKAVADEYQLPVVGPNMSLGSAKADSITAIDPIDQKETTYTFMVPFLKAFLFYMGKTDVPAVGWHTYGEMGEFRWAVNQVTEEVHKPQWVTEYAFWKAGNPEAEIRYMIEATDLLERSPQVAAYAWFKERVNENRKLSILGRQPGTLTALGKAYVSMPVHDADLYYQIPGKLDASRYVSADQFNAVPSREKDSFLEMQAQNGGGSICYNVNVEAAGEYTLDIRTTQSGEILILDTNKKELASVTVANKGWQTVTTTLSLPAGAQTLRLYPDSGGQAFTTLTFKKK
jgi:hypothetical protein